MKIEDATDADLFDAGLVSLRSLTEDGPILDQFPVCHSLMMIAIKEPPRHDWIENIYDTDEGLYRKCVNCGQLRLMTYDLSRLVKA